MSYFHDEERSQVWALERYARNRPAARFLVAFADGESYVCTFDTAYDSDNSGELDIAMDHPGLRRIPPGHTARHPDHQEGPQAVQRVAELGLQGLPGSHQIPRLGNGDIPRRISLSVQGRWKSSGSSRHMSHKRWF